MRIKVYKGTVSECGSSLCETCRHSTITRGRTLDEEIVRCDAQMGTVLVTFKVTDCSAYIDNRLPTYMQLMEQAWILRPGSSKRAAGFVRSSDLREDEFRDVMTEFRDRFDK